jgi:hypothetical protein
VDLFVDLFEFLSFVFAVLVDCLIGFVCVCFGGVVYVYWFLFFVVGCCGVSVWVALARF